MTVEESKSPEQVFEGLRNGSLRWGDFNSPLMLSMEWNVKTGWDKPRIHDYAPISLPPSASIFHYGMVVFEGLKAFKTEDGIHIYRPQLNAARMNKSAVRIGLPTIDEELQVALLKAYVWHVKEWIPELDVGALYLRPVLFATDKRLGIRKSDTALFYIMSSPITSFFKKDAMDQGIRLKVDPQYIRAWPGGMGYCKTGGNYAISIAPAHDAKQEGYDQILWLSDPERRKLTEVGMMNVFIVKKTAEGETTLTTPRLDGTILDGVTRRSVLEMAQEMGYKTDERDITLDEVFEETASGTIKEAFGTGTAALISPIGSIQCENEKAVFEDHEFSSMIKEKLLTIQSSGSHRWMETVCIEDGVTDVVNLDFN